MPESPPATFEPYQYQPFNREIQFRLLRITFARDDLPLYDVVVYKRAEAPPYETVSYVWGYNLRNYAFLLRTGQGLLINENLAAAFPYLTKASTCGFLWIDQLSINQDDISERNVQVKHMGDIYRESQGVLIWLGRYIGASDVLIKLAHAA